MHWIGAQFCICMFLDSNMLNFVGTIKENERNEITKGAFLLRNPLTIHKIHSLVSKKCSKKFTHSELL